MSTYDYELVRALPLSMFRELITNAASAQQEKIIVPVKLILSVLTGTNHFADTPPRSAGAIKSEQDLIAEFAPIADAYLKYRGG